MATKPTARLIEPGYTYDGRVRTDRYDTSQLIRTGDNTFRDDLGNTFDGKGRIVAAPSGGGGGVAPSGSNGLYDAAVGSPWYQQALAATRSAEAADAAARKSAIQQALIQFGMVPEGFQDKYGDIDATTRSLATQNTTSGISAFARLKQALADSQRDASRRLAAKGLRRSGARGYALRKNQLGFDQNYSDAVGKLLGYTSGLYGNFANNAYQRQMGLSGALGSAINNMSGWYTPPSVSYTPSGGSAAGGNFPGQGTETFQTQYPYLADAPYRNRGLGMSL